MCCVSPVLPCQVPEVVDGSRQPLLEVYRWLPSQALPGHADVRFPSPGVVIGKGKVLDAGAGAGEPDDRLGERADLVLPGVSQVEGADQVVRPVHHPHQALDHVVDVAEGAGLGAVAVDGDGVVPKGLEDEAADHPAVRRVHVRAVGVEDAHHPNIHAVLAVVVEEQGLGATFGFIITGSATDGIDVAPVGFRLGMDLRIAVYLRS